MKQMLSAVLILAAATVYAVDFSPVNVGGIVSVAGKQDTLPYDTNAIPWSVIVQKPDIPTSSITNGLASESWVIGKNYVTESITNSLATVAHTGSYNDLSNKPTIPAPYVPSPTDATFSNAVLSVALNIDTNSVAVLNEIASTFGGFPITGTATTVGGLLAALAAAIAWLRKKKIDKITCSGVADITTENGTANVSTLFSGANTSLGSTIDAKLPYRKVTDSATDRAVYLYTVESESPTIAIPAVGSGITDFEVWLDATNYATDYEATFTGATILYKDGSALTFEKSAVTVVHFTACNGVAYTAASAVFKAIA